MKKLLILLVALSIIACKNETKENLSTSDSEIIANSKNKEEALENNSIDNFDKTSDNGFAMLSGKITNPNSKKLEIVDAKNITIKTIILNEDGTFKDTLKVVKKDMYALSDGNEYAALFLANGYDLSITLDTKAFDETLKVTGKGSKGSNYLAKKMLLQEETFTNINDLYALDKSKFMDAINQKKKVFSKLKNSFKNLDPVLAINDTNDTKMLFEFIVARYDKVADLFKMKGKPSPKFINYENYKGGTTSLDDLKGKYVYIDIWATWCGPCKAEIPYLKEIEEEFHGKNIAFVSISIDQKDAHDKWKEMIAEKKMGGIQLFADNDWKSQFVVDYGIKGIPRFLLIDTKGNVLNPDAPRPSNPKLKDVLTKLIE